MNVLAATYRPSLALLTDLYELTMAYGYWKAGLCDREAAFHLTYRENPFGGGYAVACGLEPAVEFLQRFRFEPDDLDYLAALRGEDDGPLFEGAFLDFLGRLRLACDIDAVPEGTVVFAHEPLVRVTGPIIQSQVIESALLNFINFQTLIATKAARIVEAAEGHPVLEFGLRRAQGIDGALSAARAAYVGGCAATSNVLAGRLYGIPVKGTHAHSWVMCFDDELAAFETYARALPNNCVFLVDTYDTLSGVRHAIEVAGQLRRQGRRLSGVRLDSGDLAYLSIEARKLLDAAGLADVPIIASSELDESIITSLKEQGAKIAVWGVGTRLVTGHGEAALGGVYKLTAVRRPGGPWEDRVKLSEQQLKTSTPGVLQVRRFHDHGEFIGDAIYDVNHTPTGSSTIVDPADATRRKTFHAGTESSELLVPVFRGGRQVYELPPLEAIRRRVAGQLAALHPGVKRLVNPHRYPVGLEIGLYQRKTALILKQRGYQP
jgi:nicotinate phosphoribosyltransferase